MTSITPGFAYITGIFGCFNYQVLDPVCKPKTITFDVEIPIGEDDKGHLRCVKGVLHYFVPSHECSPSDGCKYFVSGKVVSISQTDADEKLDTDYDLQIEALTVRSFPLLHGLPSQISSKLFLLSDVDNPPRTQIIITGQVRSHCLQIRNHCLLSPPDDRKIIGSQFHFRYFPIFHET